MLECLSGNKILNKMGLSVLDATIGGEICKAPVSSQAIKDTYLFRHLLHRFAGHVINSEILSEQEIHCLKKLGKDCVNYLHTKAHDWPSYSLVVSVLTDILMKSGMPQVSRQSKTMQQHEADNLSDVSEQQ